MNGPDTAVARGGIQAGDALESTSGQKVVRGPQYRFRGHSLIISAIKRGLAYLITNHFTNLRVQKMCPKNQ